MAGLFPFGEPLSIFPFFVGSGRSGTTLFQAIFSAHPALVIVHESHFIAPLAGRRRRYERSEGFDAEALMVDLFRNPNFRRLGIAPDQLREVLGHPPTADYPEAVRRIFGLYSRRQGKPSYGDKTPGYVSHIGLLARLFPEARFLHIIRDGRDVALGYMDARWGPGTIPEAALYWKHRVIRGRTAGARLAPRRYREVRYEDLLEDPEATVRSLCPFVGVEFDERMLRYFEAGEDLVAGTADPSAQRALTLPPSKGLRNWRSQMTARDVAVFEALAGDLLEGLGYETSQPPSGIGVLAEASLSVLRWHSKRAVSLTRRVARRLDR